MGFFTGKKGRFEQRSLLGQEQQPLYQQLLRAGQGSGGGGAFGQSADYYRDLLNPDSQTFNQMQAPEMRNFRENIIPELSEQFAGMGSGGLSSSGFRNAAVNAGTDLSERLGAIRAQLRQQGAQGLTNIGQQGLGQFNENIYRQGQPGFLDFAGQGLGMALPMFAGGIGQGMGSNLFSSFGKSSPYGQANNASALSSRMMGR